jgi:hypothetical protein
LILMHFKIMAESESAKYLSNTALSILILIINSISYLN